MEEGTTTKEPISLGATADGGASFLNPEHIVGSLGLKSGNTVADFGCGAGFFVLPVSRVVGSSGRVHAIEIQKEALSALRAKASTAHLLNIDYIWADLELPSGSHLPPDSVDLVIISNILFQSSAKAQIIGEGYRVLKPGGRIAMIEWDDLVTGPPQHLRIKKSEVIDCTTRAGFSLVQEFNAGSHHYGLLFIKR